MVSSLVVCAQEDTVYCESGLKYVKIQNGEGNQPVNGQTVKIHYTGKFMDGTVFDEVKGRSFFSFKIGDTDIIEGWHEGFKLMRAGEKGIFVIPSFLAYGKKGFKDPDDPGEYLIPPNAMLVFEVELISIK